MNLKDKLAALDQIYHIYDRFMTGQELACKKGCAHCCTTSVTLTTIEGYKIIEQLISEKDADWTDKILRASEQAYFRPHITTNQLAHMCAQGIEPPEEKQPEQTACPFLSQNQCPLYRVRPFGCRCLVSRHDCSKHGYADIDDFVLSVNTVLLQSIEHLDADGCSGNLLDVLKVMAGHENRQAYTEGKLDCTSTGLIQNQPLKILMIPPEHRTRMESILQSLRNIRF
jgi:Fe-S-cluster containining protein